MRAQGPEVGNDGRHDRLQAEGRTCIGMVPDNFRIVFVPPGCSLADAAFVPGTGDGAMNPAFPCTKTRVGAPN
ncbi:hypothetical protein G6F59_014011 [Rhizopus arrhizus]|nr:hypothetical protein G6F59_014011 [Rhizopus arrhizus]